MYYDTAVTWTLESNQRNQQVAYPWKAHRKAGRQENRQTDNIEIGSPNLRCCRCTHCHTCMNFQTWEGWTTKMESDRICTLAARGCGRADGMRTVWTIPALEALTHHASAQHRTLALCSERPSLPPIGQLPWSSAESGGLRVDNAVVSWSGVSWPAI